MSLKFKKESAEIETLRREHNRELIKKMRNGEALTSFDSQSSWFPPRPMIKKDEKIVSELYSEAKPKTSKRNSKAEKSAKVVTLARNDNE